MPIRRSPNGAAHTSPQTDRDRPEWVIGSSGIRTRDEKRFVRARMKLLNEVTKYGTFAQGCPTHSYRAWVSPSLVIWTSPPRQLSLTVS